MAEKEKQVQNGVVDIYKVRQMFDNSKGNLPKKYYKSLESLRNSGLLINSLSKDNTVSFTHKFIKALRKEKYIIKKLKTVFL